MGVNITEILPMKEISFRDLSGKVIVVDASLFLYQFLTSIRQPDGTPLTDSDGNITSHLTGLFSRTVRLMNYGMKLAYVFDGKPPELKRKERERRNQLKVEAEAKYKVAQSRGDIAAMRKYGSRTTRLTKEIVDESKELLRALGIPVIQAPSEAEAQAAYIVKKGDAYALASQDSDTMMFGTPKLIRNLSLVGRKKKVNALAYKSVKPEMVELSEVLNSIGIDNDQMIALCMLVGTDYNKGGIKGIGPKNAIKLVKKHGTDFKTLFDEVKWDEHCETDWKEIFYLIKKMPVTDDYSLRWEAVDEERVKKLLVELRGFSLERVENSIKKIVKESDKLKQKALGDFF